MALIASDAFNRADSTTTLGTADTGQAWSALSGTWGISSDRAYTSVTTADSNCAVDVGSSDMTVTATIVTRDGGSCVIARVQDVSNYYLVLNAAGGGTSLYKKVAGAFTQIGSQITGNADGDVIALKVLGATQGVYRNGSLIISGTDSALATGTKAGLRCDTNNARFDDFSVTAFLSQEFVPSTVALRQAAAVF